MTYRQLLRMSKENFERYEGPMDKITLAVFDEGARWMHRQLNKISEDTIEFNASVPYTAYGLLKYSLSLLCFFAAAVQLCKLHVLFIPLAVIAFYFIEVHFLFLFPLLIDGVKHPVLKSIKATYLIGLFNAMYIVSRIAFFMFAGLFNFSNPLRNWYIGCLAIITWYQYEVRNRI